LPLRIADRIVGRPRTSLLGLFTAGLLLAFASALQVALAALLASIAAAAARMLGGGPGPVVGGSRSSAFLWAAIAGVSVIFGSCIGEIRGSELHPRPVRTHAVGKAGIGHPEANGILELIRGRARTALEPGLPPTVSALLIGMALGDDSGLPASVREEFRRASLTHVTAASGQNVALLLVLVSVIPVWVAQRIGGGEITRGGR
jgi:hypothetical protein